MLSLGAPIVELKNFPEIRKMLHGTVVATGGGYDPIHPGHLSNIIESKQQGDVLVVIVNGDTFLKMKKGRPFQDLATRCAIVSAVRGVDYVVPYETDEEMGVSGALAVIQPHKYTKGGDRATGKIRDEGFCKEHGIELVTGIGVEKEWSSSDFLDEWVKSSR